MSVKKRRNSLRKSEMKFQKFVEMFQYTLRNTYTEMKLHQQTDVTFDKFVRLEYYKYQRTKFMTQRDRS